MRVKRIAIFALGLSGLLLACVALVGWRREPRYAGKSLYYWMAVGDTNEQDAAVAIQHMGKSTFPQIKKWLWFRPSPWRGKVENAISHFPPSLVPKRLEDWLNEDEAGDAMGAGWVIYLLGKEAVPIAPDLVRLAHERRPELRWKGIEFLGSLDIDGLTYLQDLALDPHYPDHAWVLEQIHSIAEKNPQCTNTFPRLVVILAEPIKPSSEEQSVRISE